MSDSNLAFFDYRHLFQFIPHIHYHYHLHHYHRIHLRSHSHSHFHHHNQLIKNIVPLLHPQILHLLHYSHHFHYMPVYIIIIVNFPHHSVPIYYQRSYFKFAGLFNCKVSFCYLYYFVLNFRKMGNFKNHGTRL